ncbi:MAG: hypothetical protein WED33_02005 [Bacteroidia bacterium]
MKKSYKVIVIITLVALVSGAYLGYRMWNKPHADATEMPGIKVSAQELVTAFETNEDSANTKYLSQVVEVTGTIANINVQDTLVYVNLTYPEAMMGGVQVTVDDRFEEQAKQLKEGSDITIKGFCNGYLMDVILKDGVLVEGESKE